MMASVQSRSFRRLKALVIDLSLHVSVTAFLALFIYLSFERITYVLLVVAAGIFIDLDHLIDFFLYKRRFHLMDFLTAQYLQSGKVYVFFTLGNWSFVLASWG